MITIRTARQEDAEATLALQYDIVQERLFLESTPEEFTKTVEEQRIWLAQLLENERGTIFVAEADGYIVGWIAFASPNRARLVHTGSISILVKKEYRNVGVGKLLLQRVLDWAMEHPIIEKVCLSVYATNERAIAVYEKLGFVEEGRRVRAYKFGENEYVDAILMYTLVS